MDVSIVIRTKNEGQYIEKTLKRLLEQDSDCKYEIIIVDSDSTDATLDIIKKYDVRLIQITQEEFSYGRSLNIGASHAKGKFVVSLSAHALPRDKNWLANLITGFEDENVAGIYGRQLSEGNINPFEAYQNELFFGQEEVEFKMGNRKRSKYGHFSNSNCAIRRDVWQRFKFDEHVPYAEDILWQREVMQRGFSIVYSSDAIVYHTHVVSICNAFRNSKACAYSLASMTRKKQSVMLGVYDLTIFLFLISSSMFQNLMYVLRNRHYQYLKITPFYVMAKWFGWLVGRTKYRLMK